MTKKIGFSLYQVRFRFYWTYVCLQIRLPGLSEQDPDPDQGKKLTNPDPYSDSKTFTNPTGQK